MSPPSSSAKRPAGLPTAPAAAAATSSPAAAWNSTWTAPTPPPPPSTSACSSACPARARSGYGTLTGQGNGQGGREHGQKADQLPGYRKITDPAARAHVAEVWGVPESLIPGPGLPAVQLLKSLGQPDGVRCLFVHASNIAVASPDANAVIGGLRSLDFLVVCDFFMSETAAEADLVLPVLQWAEEEGTLTNLEGRVLRRRQAIQPPAGARSELWIMAQLAEALEAPSTYSDDPETVFEELRLASAGGAGRLLRHRLRHARRRRGRLLAVPRGQHRHAAAVPGRALRTPDGKAVMTPVRPAAVVRRQPIPTRPPKP